MLPQTFLALIIVYQLALAARDFTVTGLMARGQPADWKFYSYCIVTTIEVTALAALAALTEPNTLIAALKAWTVMLCWIGGVLDWIYFGLRKLVSNEDFPKITMSWFWMPAIFPYITHEKITFSHPTTKHWIVYTALMWTPCIIGWIIVLT